MQKILSDFKPTVTLKSNNKNPKVRSPKRRDQTVRQKRYGGTNKSPIASPKSGIRGAALSGKKYRKFETNCHFPSFKRHNLTPRCWRSKFPWFIGEQSMSIWWWWRWRWWIYRILYWGESIFGTYRKEETSKPKIQFDRIGHGCTLLYLRINRSLWTDGWYRCWSRYWLFHTETIQETVTS